MKFYNLVLLFKLFLVCVCSLNFLQTIHASHDEPSTLINARTVHNAAARRILIERGEVTNRYAVLDKTETVLSAKGQNAIDKALNDINGIAAAIQMDLRAFITWAHQKHVMITEENRLRDAIDTAVSAIKRQHLKVDLWILAYQLAWTNYAMEIQSYNSHESHQGSTSGDLIVPPHVKDWKVRREFSDYKCEGYCDIIFDSPGEAETSHQVTCGSDFYVVWHLIDGCGREYYKCPGHDVPSFHDVFRCTRHNYEKIDGKKVKVYCGKHFRQCTNYVIDNNGRYSSLVTPSGYCTKLFLEGVFGVHSYFSSDAPSSWETAYTDDADDSADAGDGSSSAMHACGIHATTVSGSHSQITPPCGDSAHAGYACQISSDHNIAMSGWSGPFYECQPHTNYPCGHTDPTANSAYHAYHTSCTSTNANGDSCTVTNFYDCGQHTHVYPAPTISCGRSGCSQTVSSSTQHSATCASGHSYWTCKPSDVSLHITRTCRLSTCGKSWERCSTVGGTPLCDDPWRRSNGLPCWKK